MSTADQVIKQDNNTIGQYKLISNAKGDPIERKISKLKFIIKDASDEDCRKALQSAYGNLNNAALLLLEKNVNHSKDEDKEKIKISDKILKKFNGVLSLFVISQVLFMCNNDEDEAMSILCTMI